MAENFKQQTKNKKMVFVFFNKNTHEIKCFGSIKAISDAKIISGQTLYNHFSRKKSKVFENDTFKILKKEITRCKAPNRKKKPAETPESTN